MSMNHFRQNLDEHTPKMFSQMFETFSSGFCRVIAGGNLAESVLERTAARASSAVVRKASQYFLLGIHKALAFSFVIYAGLGFVLAAYADSQVLQTEPCFLKMQRRRTRSSKLSVGGPTIAFSENSSNELITFDEFVELSKAFIARKNAPTRVVCGPRESSDYVIIRATQRFVVFGWFDRVIDGIILRKPLCNSRGDPGQDLW
ncbi:hypothetical protein GQ600_14514 [Phytophthora cactorum]|nr:hypothetical protein GQ600_14514 [Phytophthora cactorum]